MIAIVDTGPLYAALDADDANHKRALGVLERRDLRLVVPTLVVGEVLYLAGTRLGASVEARFLRGLEEMDVEAPSVGDWKRMAELVETYADFPLGGVDASVVALAERIGAEIVVTVDHRHFGAVRPRHCDAFELLPE